MKRSTVTCLVTAALVAGACAGGGDSAGPARPAPSGDARDAFVEYARCLRAAGMDVPDPEPSGGGGAVGAMAVPAPRTEAERRAVASCEDRLPAGGSQGERPGSAADSTTEALLAHARCMREHGVDYPDPRVLPDGALEISPPARAGEPAFDRAQEACRHLGGPHVVEGGGASISRRCGV